MNEKLDAALRHALTPRDKADFQLNRKILNSAAEQRTINEKQKRRISPVPILASLALCISSVTVYAAWQYLSPSAVAEDAGDRTLAEAFSGSGTAPAAPPQCFGEYQVTLLGLISGEMLSDYPHYHNGNLAADRTYAVIAIETADGAPLPDTSQEGYGELEFFASPLIGGYNPALYNMASMSGNYTDVTEDGILYRLLECDNVEIFADHDLYLCVSQGAFYQKEAYCYDETTGKISRNEEYQGLNALFDLTVDPSKADPEKAAAYMADLGVASDLLTEKLNAALEDSFEVKAEEGNREGAEAAAYALQFTGNPYAWGEESLTEGTDSSGFTKSVYANFGINLPHSSAEQRKAGTKVESLADALPGDLLFYETPSHVAVYLGDGLIVHAMPEMGICVSEADFDRIAEIRRITAQD